MSFSAIDFSAVTHVAKNKGIPPFLILDIAGHPDTGAQARRLADVLQAAGISAKVVAGQETTHASMNDNIGAANDPVTAELLAFIAQALKPFPPNPGFLFRNTRRPRCPRSGCP